MHSFVDIESFRTLIPRYDTFIFDLWGTIYDGTAVFPDFLLVLSELRRYNKTVKFLSNSPRRSVVSKERLAKCGLDLEVNDIITSGEYFAHLLSTSEYGLQKFFLIGNDSTVLEGFNINVSDTLSDANYLLITLSDQTQDVGVWKDVMIEAVQRGIPAVCINPDLEVFHGQTKFYTPGYYAMQYEKLGGDVIYFGKPYKDVYNFILSKNGSLKSMLAVGDAVGTDIKGAHDQRIDSLLVLGNGIHKNIQKKDKIKILSLCQQYKCYPKYIMNKLTLD